MMSLGFVLWVLLIFAVVSANYPWLSNRVFFVLPEPERGKSGWMRLLEWCASAALCLLLGLGLERKLNGVIHTQQWEFYVVSAVFFMVLAMPGFIYHYDLKRYLKRYAKQKAALQQK